MNGCILMFGMPRSGTTWVGKLIDSHPDTLYRHEPDSVQRLSLPLYPEVQSAADYRDELQRFVAALPYKRAPKVVGKQPLFPKRYHSGAALGMYRLSVAAAKAASRVKPHCPCPYRPTAAGGANARVVWKSIESPGRLGVCMQALPEARAIFLMRHPCGYVASVLRGEAARRFSDSKPSADDLWMLEALLATSSGKARGIGIDDLKSLTPEERLAWRWVLTQEKVLADVADCERVLTLRYEDICADPLTMTWRLLAFVGLEWSAQVDAFVQASTRVGDATRETDYYSVYKQPHVAAERWRSELAPEVIERIMRIFRGSRLHRLYSEQMPARSPLPEVTG
ncbi:MAG TPA: sulfotransferase [Oleiagrimonas sp.]|nr:sulfotransferase [Oleiagrimonas sp.]